MLQHEQPDDYVVASGTTAAIREFCDLAFTCAGLESDRRFVPISDKFMRPADELATEQLEILPVQLRVEVARRALAMPAEPVNAPF